MVLKPRIILFLSTENAARSLMAEALVNAKKSELFVARSAGVYPALMPHEETIALLKANSFETDSLHTKPFDVFQDLPDSLRPDVVITLSEEARALPMVWAHQPVQVHWALDNPLSAERADVREWKFRKCFATLENRVRSLVCARRAPTESELFLQLKAVGMVV